MSTATIVGDRLLCVNRFLYCLDLGNDLKEIWKIRPDGISAYGSIIASKRRLLVVANDQLLYLPTDGARKILAQQKVADQSHPIYSHPAIVGKRFFFYERIRPFFALNSNQTCCSKINPRFDSKRF